MEKIGRIKIFEHYIENHGFRFTSLYGDRDTSERILMHWALSKKKRVGNRLHKLRKEQNRLANSKINTLQNYFGIALRQNTGNLEKISN